MRVFPVIFASMEPSPHKPPFIPQGIGVSYVAPDESGRVTIPSEFRGRVFGDVQPPFAVVLCLVGRGGVAMYPANRWPMASERRLLEDAKKVLVEVDLDHLTPAQLGRAQSFFRLLACRYVDGMIRDNWRLLLPSAVRAWLRLPPLESKKRDKRRAQVGMPKRPESPGLVVVGNLGAIEFWSESELQEAIRADSATFKELTTEMNELRDSVKPAH